MPVAVLKHRSLATIYLLRHSYSDFHSKLFSQSPRFYFIFSWHNMTYKIFLKAVSLMKWHFSATKVKFSSHSRRLFSYVNSSYNGEPVPSVRYCDCRTHQWELAPTFRDKAGYFLGTIYLFIDVFVWNKLVYTGHEVKWRFWRVVLNSQRRSGRFGDLKVVCWTSIRHTSTLRIGSTPTL